MADIGAVTGIIGAITSGIALVISIKSYQRVSAMKALDLRLELQKAFNSLDMDLSGIDGYLDFVHQSHLRVLAATGRNQSGEMKISEVAFLSDKARLRGLLGSQPQREVNYERIATNELEERLVSVHASYLQLSELRGKYQRLFESDEERWKELRARHG